MKATRRLNIKDWSGCLFYNMTNINDFDNRPLFVNDFKNAKMDQQYLTQVIVRKIMYHIVFNNIECIFRKSGVFSYLICC